MESMGEFGGKNVKGLGIDEDEVGGLIGGGGLKVGELKGMMEGFN